LCFGFSPKTVSFQRLIIGSVTISTAAMHTHLTRLERTHLRPGCDAYALCHAHTTHLVTDSILSRIIQWLCCAQAQNDLHSLPDCRTQQPHLAPRQMQNLNNTVWSALTQCQVHTIQLYSNCSYCIDMGFDNVSNMPTRQLQTIVCTTTNNNIARQTVIC
jgi:hypothetical protein